VHLLITSIGFGLVQAAILSISAMGFSLQFGMTNVLNLSYGSLMTIGAFLTLLISEQGISIWLGVLVGAIAVGFITLVIGRVIIRRFANRGSRLFEMAIVTVALALIIDYIIAAITKSAIFQFLFPLGSNHQILGMTFTTTQLDIMAIAIVTIIGLELVLHKTNLGISIRASAANGPLARASGIPTNRVVRLTWFVSGVLCGLGGALLAVTYLSVSFVEGTNYLPYILAAVVVAGIGAVGYAALASLILALVIEIAGSFGAGSYNVAIAVGVLLLMLLVRPRGFFGELWEKSEAMG